MMLWTSLALQARRFRDIGWNPLYVIAAWMVIGVLDALVAHINPALSLGAHRGTIVGMLVNLTLSLSLLFLPGRADEDIGTGRGPTRTTRVDSLNVEAAEAPRSVPMPRGRRATNSAVATPEPAAGASPRRVFPRSCAAPILARVRQPPPRGRRDPGI